MPSPIVSGRLTLLNAMFKETLTGVSGALRAKGMAPLKAEEKEVLFGEVEKAVWALPDAWFEETPRDELAWAEEIGSREPVRKALELAVAKALAGRRAPGSP